ncbi:MAG: right-handed parallel beta-helix repeat-containing protein, partial [Calditrichota bacterium]
MRNVLVLSLSLLLLIAPGELMGATYVFGEDGNNQDLTGTGGPGSTWPSGNTYIIAGDVYVPDDSTLTLEAGVKVYFDYDYDLDYTTYPTIEVRGTLVCEGTSVSYVYFTNYSGTNRGEFQGLKANGSLSSGYEGTIEAAYTIFEYGGRNGALITLGADSYLEMSNSWVRFSDSCGIGTSAEFDSLKMEWCCVDSNDAEGIQISHSCDAVILNDVIAFENGICLQAGRPRLEYRGVYVENARHNGIELDTNQEPHIQNPVWRILIERSHAYHCAENGIYINAREEGLYGDIRNCASAGNGENGILVDAYDPFAQEEPFRVLNSVFWDNGESGIKVIPTETWLDQEEDIFIIQNCILGLNEEYGLEVIDGDYVIDFGDNINAYKDNGDGSYNLAVEPPEDEIKDMDDVPDHFELADETYTNQNPPQHPPYDFHIKWDSPELDERTLINEGEEDEDCGQDV